MYRALPALPAMRAARRTQVGKPGADILSLHRFDLRDSPLLLQKPSQERERGAVPLNGLGASIAPNLTLQIGLNKCLDMLSARLTSHALL
ncbi:hypothetical protein A4R35_23515 [Thermogemmatispora tikiterensis]|uniref:Uncharacterized protein n=1 Tax=Thermogemmatispora tikiterensis TaxID=1825093 RepID=A0A328VMP0_9CHLR|nr:hypothetical protein A4R35_23515 [Thermogemmatispora tikiterensis]